MAQILKIARTLNVIFLGSFIIFALGLGAFFIFTSIQFQSLTNSSNQIKTQITAQGDAEQKLVLLKDRLGKIQVVEAVPNAEANLKNDIPFVTSLAGESALTGLDIDAQKTDMSVLFRTNNDLTNFIKSVKDSKNFKLVVLTSFGFNPASGYLVSLHMI